MENQTLNTYSDELPIEVKDHLKGEQGDRIFLEIGNVLHEYIHDEDYFIADRFTRKIKAETAWFENIIKHQPSVGQFYENLLRTALREFVPSSIKVGTGFIFDSMKKQHSQQLDIILYNDFYKAPVYQNGEFVVVIPEQVISICEVKKTLRANDLKNLIFKNFLFNNGTYPEQLNNIQYINLFAFDTRLTNKTLCNSIISIINDIINKFKPDSHNQYPILNITLPNIYFFNKNQMIETTLKINKENKFQAEVNVVGTSSKENSSLGEFLLRCVGNSSKSEDMSKKNFINSPLHLVLKNRKPLTTNEFYLYDKISMLEASNHFRSDFIMKTFTINKQRPYCMYVPKGFNWRNYNTLIELVRTNMIRFELF